MKLNKFFKNLNKNFINTNFNGFEFDSNKIKKNNIFFAIKGSKFDGNKFINNAIKNGANVVVSNKFKTGIYENVLFINVPDPRLTLSNFATKFYTLKPNNIVGVTGTNGKSSIADFYYQILKLNNIPVATIGTFGVKSRTKIIKTNLTSPDIISLHKNL